MPKRPKEDRKEAEEPPDSEDENTLGADQKNRKYYYDDAHGYEIYEPDEEDDAEARNAEPRA